MADKQGEPCGSGTNPPGRTTSAQRMKKLRAKRKTEDATFQQRESDRIEQLRKDKVKNMNDSTSENYRKNARDRKRASRMKQKAQAKSAEKDTTHVTVTQSSFRSPQSYGKAVRKSQNNLPHSPRKRVSVICGLAARHGLKLSMKAEREMHKHANALDANVVQTVKDFYLRMDIVYTCPGMDDCVTVWENGTKRKERKFYLTMYLREAYQMFVKAYPDIKIGFSKFCSLKPKNVLLLKQHSTDQCKCKLHENFTLKLKALKIVYDSIFWVNILCDSETLTGNCWKGTCNTCSSGKLLVIEGEKEKDLVWEEWGKGNDGRLKIELKKGCLGELEEIMRSDLEAFQEHVRIKRAQSNLFELEKSNPNCTVFQMDFAMAYSCEYQDEIQSALWSRKSVNLLTAALFTKDQPCQSFLYVTDSTDKGKNTVYTCVLKFFEYVVKSGMDLGEYVSIFTDGPSSEFKNKFMVQLLKEIEETLGLPVKWEYFATSHGKGVVDGIGGAAKSLVRQNVMARKTIVQNSQNFASCVTELMPRVKVFHVSQEEIDEFIHVQNPWEDILEVPGISKAHSVQFCEGRLELKATYLEEAFVLQQKQGRHSQPITVIVDVDKWVVVQYDNKNYPGVVCTTSGDLVEVSVMHSTFGQKWCWPDKEDKIFYNIQNIVKNVSAPVPVDNRGHFSFNESIFDC